MFRIFSSALLCTLLLIPAALLHAEDSTDEAGIRQAVLNYANSIYQVAPELLDGSIHPKLQKVGYWSAKDGEGYEELWMTLDQLKQLAGSWNKDGTYDAATAKREVKILDHLDQIAVARLDAEWGVDYLELVKQDTVWMIVNVVWQSYPASSE